VRLDVTRQRVHAHKGLLALVAAEGFDAHVGTEMSSKVLPLVELPPTDRTSVLGSTAQHLVVAEVLFELGLEEVALLTEVTEEV
jgi:hypothetical protein